MRTSHLFLVLPIAFALSSCGKEAPQEQKLEPRQQEQSKSSSRTVWTVDLPANPDESVVRDYLRGLPEQRVVLSTETVEISFSNKQVLAWLIRALHESVPDTHRHYRFRLSRVKIGSPHAYEVRRLTALSPTLLRADTPYVQVHYYPNEHIACPESHGVIDIEDLKVLSTWSES